MHFQPTKIDGCLLLQPEVFGDARGFFMESWNRRVFAAAGHDWEFVQDNHSRSARGVLRGLHFQTQSPQGKLVRVVAGAVFDVAVDLRRGSPSFGDWFGVELSAEGRSMLYVPPGCAHGFLALSEFAEVLYKATDYYRPECELTLRWDDATVGIDWPLAPGEGPTLSAKDARGLSWGEIPFYEHLG